LFVAVEHCLLENVVYFFCQLMVWFMKIAQAERQLKQIVRGGMLAS
jgi:hypothetical protein